MAAGSVAYRARVVLVSLFLLTLALAPALAQPALTLAQQEEFLKSARVVRTRSTSKGVTGTTRATLTDGTLTHDAQIQTVDQAMQVFQSNRGTELNFKDTWRYNVAAYRLNKVLQLGRIPPSVERTYSGKPGAFTWWVDDVLMDEAERLKTKPAIPDNDSWNRQIWHVRIFDQLIYNVDRNLGNLLIDKSWSVWMIDHSRAFRLLDTLRSPQDLRKIERTAFERLKALDAAVLKDAVGEYLTPEEQKRLLIRRDVIVQFFTRLGSAAFFDTTAPQR